MPEAAAPVATGNSRDAILARAEAAIGDMDDAPDVDLAAEAGNEPEADLFGADGDAPEAEESEEDQEVVEGSQAAPFTVKTLPDAYVTLKIDGEEQTVSVREMTDGYMREQAFHKRMNQVNALTEQAKAAATSFKEQSDKFRSSFTQLISTPDDLYEFLDEHNEATLDAVARRRLALMLEEQKNPQKRMEREREKHQRLIDKQRKKLETERGEYQRTRSEEEAHRKYLAAFKPGYDAGMKKAGYPKVTDDFRVTVNGLLTARKQLTGGELTAKDIEDAVVRAAKLSGAETVADRKPVPSPAAKLGPKPAAKAAKAPAQAKSFSQLFRDLGK